MARPSFPSLYNPQPELDSRRRGTTQIDGKYLDNAHDVFRFTLYWMLILHVPLFVLTGSCAALILATAPLRKHTAQTQARKRSAAYGTAVFLLYSAAGALFTVIGAVVVGFLIAGVYAAGRFRVSTWIPFVWALLQTLISVTSMCSLIIDII